MKLKFKGSVGSLFLGWLICIPFAMHALIMYVVNNIKIYDKK